MNIDKPFNYFLALCLETARDVGDVPAWHKNNELCAHYGVEGSIRVTEDDEFLMESPLSVKQVVESPANKIRDPRREKAKMQQIKNNPQFDGTTYTYRGKEYLRPKEGKEWINPEVEERLNMPEGHWENEKRKFIEIAKQGKIEKQGLEYLIYIGMLSPKDLDDLVKTSTQYVASGLIEAYHDGPRGEELRELQKKWSAEAVQRNKEEELNEISEETEKDVLVPNKGRADPISEGDGDTGTDTVERVQTVAFPLHTIHKEPTR